METTVLVSVYVIIIGMFIFRTWISVLNYNNRNAEIPEEVNDVYDEVAYKKWLEYNMANNKISSIIRVIDVAVTIVLLVFGVLVWFNDLAILMSDNVRVQVLLFMGLYYLVSFFIGIATSYYDTFVIEEKFGFNKMTKKTFVIDKIKGLLLTIVFGGGLVFLLLVINDHAGNLFFLFTWLALVAILFIVQMLYVQVIVPLFNKLTPLEDGELSEAINAFAKSVGYEVSQINVMDASKRSSKLNAFFSGFGKLKKIVLYDTLIEKMSTEEIVAVLAHEIGHNKHKHMYYNMFQTALTLLLYIGVFVLVLNNEVFSTAFGFENANFGFSMILFGILLGPVSFLIQLASSYFSRKHEYQSDKFASFHYSKEHMESALKVLAKENFANLTPHPLYVKLFYSHPPIVDRIRAIRKVEKNV